MTPKFFSMANQSRWSSPRNSRSRDLRLHWSASTMSGRHMSPISMPSASAARFRSGTRRTPPSAASPRQHSAKRPCRSKPNIACRSNTIIQWSHSRPPRCGRATAGSPSSIRRKDRRTAATTLPACSGCRATRCVFYALMSEAHLDPGCVRNMNCRSRCSPPSPSSARCASLSPASRCSRSAIVLPMCTSWHSEPMSTEASPRSGTTSSP